jgi:hypothetical protein
MNPQDPIDADRIREDVVNYGANAIEDATDPFLTSLAIIGELAGMDAFHCIIDVLEDYVPGFDRARVIEMNDDFAAHHADWLARLPARRAAILAKVAA